MAENRPVGGGVVADFVAFGLNARDQFGVGTSAIADEEERGVGVLVPEDVEDLGREDGMRSVVEGESNERLASADAVEEVGSEALEPRQDAKRLHPEDVQNHNDDGDEDEQK